MFKGYYEIYSGVVQNTGWPIDGHRLIFALWDYDDRSSWHLHSWAEEDDEAVMETMYKTMVEDEFIFETERDEFVTVWKDGMFDEVYSPGAFCIDLDKLTDTRKVEPCVK